MEAVRSFAAPDSPTADPMSSMSLSAPATSAAYTTRTGMPSERSLVTASGGVPKLPPAMTRSGWSPTIFSVSTPWNVATTGSEWASGGKSATSSTLATTRSPAPSLKRISVAAGVRDTILVGSAASATEVPSSSVRVAGKAGAGVAVGSGVGAAVGAGVAEATASDGPALAAWLEPEPELVQAPTTTARARSTPKTARGTGRKKGTEGRLRIGWESEASAVAGPSRRSRRRGLQPVVCTVLPTFLSKVRACTVGRRPDFRPGWGTVTVAGLCRNHTGFATTRRGAG